MLFPEMVLHTMVAMEHSPVGGQPIQAFLSSFYPRRHPHPCWCQDSGGVSSQDCFAEDNPVHPGAVIIEFFD